MTMPYYRRSPGCADRITGRVKTARITPFTCRILIAYGRLWIVPFNLGNVIIVYGENMTCNSGVMCMTVYGVVLLVLGSRFRSKIFH